MKSAAEYGREIAIEVAPWLGDCENIIIGEGVLKIIRAIQADAIRSAANKIFELGNEQKKISHGDFYTVQIPTVRETVKRVLSLLPEAP